MNQVLKAGTYQSTGWLMLGLTIITYELCNDLRLT